MWYTDGGRGERSKIDRLDILEEGGSARLEKSQGVSRDEAAKGVAMERSSVIGNDRGGREKETHPTMENLVTLPPSAVIFFTSSSISSITRSACTSIPS